MSLKHIFTALCLLIPFISYSSSVNEEEANTKCIRLPSAEVIKERIRGVTKDDHFTENTQIHTKLGGQEVYPEAIPMQVNLAIIDYVEALKKRGTPDSHAKMMARVMGMRKQKIINAIVQPKSKL